MLFLFTAYDDQLGLLKPFSIDQPK
jgi:hypothetical protein